MGVRKGDVKSRELADYVESGNLFRCPMVSRCMFHHWIPNGTAAIILTKSGPHHSYEISISKINRQDMDNCRIKLVLLQLPYAKRQGFYGSLLQIYINGALLIDLQHCHVNFLCPAAWP